MIESKTIIFLFIALLIGLGAQEIKKTRKKKEGREKGKRIRRKETENRKDSRRSENYKGMMNSYGSGRKRDTLSNFKKGKRYEEQISKIYRERGYMIWEHGKEKGVRDRGIDIIAKRENEIIFIQCKNWNERNKWKINHKDIKSIRTEARDFIKDHPIFKDYDLRIRFVISGRILDKSAWITIKESKNIDFEIIKPDF